MYTVEVHSLKYGWEVLGVFGSGEWEDALNFADRFTEARVRQDGEVLYSS